MDIFGVVTLLSVIATVVAMCKFRKRKDYAYSKLDISGIILNVVLLCLIYPPLWVICMALGMDRYATEPLLIFLEGVAITMGWLMPAISIAGIGASIILRRKEKRKLSFLAQFAGFAWFFVTMVFAVLCGSYC